MRELLTVVDASYWSQVSAVIFCVSFVALTVWVYLPVRKSGYQRVENFPLDKD